MYVHVCIQPLIVASFVSLFRSCENEQANLINQHLSLDLSLLEKVQKDNHDPGKGTIINYLDLNQIAERAQMFATLP